MGTRWLGRLFGIAALAGSVVAVSSVLSSSPAIVDRLPEVHEVPPPIERTSIRLEFRDPGQSLPPDRIQNLQDPAKVSPQWSDRLKIPPELPGAEAPPLQLPRFDPEHPQAYDEALKRLYPPLPALGDNLQPQVIDGHPGMSLADLERMAQASNPILQQASADIRSAQGSYIQAGVLPNPTVGFAADSVRQNYTRGQVGGYISQEFVLLSKIRLARAIAASDRELANLAFVQMEAEVLAGVRSGYFAVLAAQETMRIQHALTRFTDEAYRVQIDQVKGGQAAPYEPLQLRVLAFQARGQLVQARNRYTAAWKMLAAAVGFPDLPPTLLTGGIDQPLPVLRHDVLLTAILANHSEIRSAQQKLERAQQSLRLAEINRLPNVTVNTTIQKDYTERLNNTIYNLDIGVPLPVFNRNQGNIARARAELDRARAESARVRNELSATLAGAFERYDNQRRLVVYYRDHIVPDQMRAYRGVYSRHQQDPDKASFGDIINAQQTLAGTLTGYLQSLRDAWTAVVELGKIMQTNDLAAMSTETCITQVRGPGSNGGCLIDSLAWPDAMPTPPPPIVRRTPSNATENTPSTSPPAAVPQLQIPQRPGTSGELSGSRPCAPEAGAGEHLFTSPVGPLERSTQRRKFFAWPLRRSDGDAPQMLPRADEVNPCRSEPTSLPQPPNKAPARLPEKRGAEPLPADPAKGETPSRSLPANPLDLQPIDGTSLNPKTGESDSTPRTSFRPNRMESSHRQAPQPSRPEIVNGAPPSGGEFEHGPERPARIFSQRNDAGVPYVLPTPQIPREMPSLASEGDRPLRQMDIPRSLPTLIPAEDSPAAVPGAPPGGETLYVTTPIAPPTSGPRAPQGPSPERVERGDPFRVYPQGLVPSLKLSAPSRTSAPR